eukprot:TRINITY_DN4330_c1_g1_i1.p1 TRINITY_DN4330_c1_g1~~TRINITY_DN4330_c1_g1_i1.p1  ORF type:complete len:624 (+),score=177.33 TRINITY_DN4330_c1_g1_i1:335-2206(+)
MAGVQPRVGITVIAIYTYESATAGDLTFKKGDKITVTAKDGDWWTGTIGGTTGIFPSNYVKPVDRIKSVEDIQTVKQDNTVLQQGEEEVKIERFPKIRNYLNQEGPKVLFMVLWLAGNVVYFALTFDKIKKSPAFQALGYGAVIAKCMGALLNLNCALVLVCVLRNLLAALRPTFLANIIPLDKNIVFHKHIAMFIALLAVVHTVAHYYNFMTLSQAPADALNLIVPNLSKPSDTPNPLFPGKFLGTLTTAPNVHWFSFISLPGWTGHLALLAMLFLYAGTFKNVRRTNFEVFWYSHHFFILFYAALIPHGMAALFGEPLFWKFTVGPLTLYAFERLLRFYRGRKTTVVDKVRKHPSGVIEVQYRPKGFKYKAGQYVFLSCPYISRWEYHPFTISSAPEEANVSCHIKCVGDWTKSFARLFNPNDSKEVAINLSKGEDGTALLRVDGPFGTGSQEFVKYDTLVLIGAGIGVTPFSSILKSVGYNIQRPPEHSRLKKVYFYWVMRDRAGFEWFADVLAELEAVNRHGVLEIHNYLTGALKPDDIRDIMFAQQGPDPVTGLRNPTHYGRPNWDKLFEQHAKTHEGEDIGVFFCGPRMLSKKLYATSRKYTDIQSKTKFHYHKENF